MISGLDGGDEEASRDILRGVARALLIAAAIGGAAAAMIWWSGSAVRFATDRVNLAGSPTWVVRGTAVEHGTGKPVAWAVVEDDPAGTPPFFSTTADLAGRFELATLPEPHRLRVSALGYKPSLISVGRRWYTWMPRGSETIAVALSPE